MYPINKVDICPGLYWVEIPAADLRIQCGCPADSVKHLMKRGLIVPTEKNGVRFETGPNAILLSDAMLQNGQFCNLAEFPVLQMLYRQGFLIPGHPNNTGLKPLVIGLPEAVESQLQYIFRGNYGLISREEITRTGIPVHQAQEMMRLKQRFAFGRIRPSEELLEARLLEDEAVEIRNGVLLRRLGFNRFEFSFQGDTVQVDLNLGENERYPCPFPLCFQPVRREYFGIVHLGEGDGWDPNRPAMASVVVFQGKIYLIDAGPNLLFNLTAVGISINEIEGVFHTHSHDDHFAGLPTLMRSGHRLKYFSTPLVRASVEKKLAALLSIDEELFSDYFEVVDLEFDTWNDIEGLEVKPVFSPHPVETNILFFRTLWEDGYRSYAHFADISSFRVLQGMVTDDAEKPGISQDFFDLTRERYLTPADLKKIDIGGGMIHGEAEDFRLDHSTKIILSHTSLPLNDREKAVGSSAAFGTMDVLIEDQGGYIQERAHRYLSNIFPNVQYHHLKPLLNSRVLDFNPGTIMLKAGEVHQAIHLILSGSVERIHSELDYHSLMAAGALLGEMSGLLGSPCLETYRAASFVQVLAIPCFLYREFVHRNNLFRSLERTHKTRIFLQSTPLLGEGISYSTQSQIAEAAGVVHFPPDSDIDCDHHTLLNLVVQGKLVRLLGGEVLEQLDIRDFFGEDGAFFETPGLFRYRTLEPVTVYQIPPRVLHGIPIVQWKLFEAYGKRLGTRLHGHNASRLPLIWEDHFSVGLARMDAHHKKLMQIINSLMVTVEQGSNTKAVLQSLQALQHFLQFHFVEEEELMRFYQYPRLMEHEEAHKKILETIQNLKSTAKESHLLREEHVESFLSQWLLSHVLQDDHGYGPYFNAKGLY
ncbi:MAG: bacteriohemerythrin [Magnetococcales bacterium]|nr:bacteriohemerythrin [Magnetococcales bacterium]